MSTGFKRLNKIWVKFMNKYVIKRKMSGTEN